MDNYEEMERLFSDQQYRYKCLDSLNHNDSILRMCLGYADTIGCSEEVAAQVALILEHLDKNL